jgi:predicted nucleic acid-binding protein
MTHDVVDSSVAIKWFVPEALAAEALRLQGGRVDSLTSEG